MLNSIEKKEILIFWTRGAKSYCRNCISSSSIFGTWSKQWTTTRRVGPTSSRSLFPARLSWCRWAAKLLPRIFHSQPTAERTTRLVSSCGTTRTIWPSSILLKWWEQSENLCIIYEWKTNFLLDMIHSVARQGNFQKATEEYLALMFHFS